MTKLRHKLSSSVHEVFEACLQAGLELTENGALQLIFDYLFLNTVLDTTSGSKFTGNTVLSYLQNQVQLEASSSTCKLIAFKCRLTPSIGLVMNLISNHALTSFISSNACYLAY
jgi:hypothetical protein